MVRFCRRFVLIVVLIVVVVAVVLAFIVVAVVIVIDAADPQILRQRRPQKSCHLVAAH